MKILLNILSVFISSGSAFAAVYHDIDTTIPLKCTLSSTNQNRIVVAEGRIRKAIFLDERIAVQTEEESGQAFIYPLDFIEKPITVSIVTEKGLVQDLEIKFADRSSEVVILKEKKLEELESSQNTSQDVSKIIETILDGAIPPGYVYLEGMGEKLFIRKKVIAALIARFEGEKETIYFYRIANKSRKQICLNEGEFNLSDATWTYLDKRELRRKEETFVLISVKR